MKALFQVFFIMTIPCILAAQNQDSTFSYYYECSGCGIFETFTNTEPEIELSESSQSIVLSDTSINNSTIFYETPSRKVKSDLKKQEAFLVNVYPNPIIDKFFINLESTSNMNSEILIYDISSQIIKKYPMEIKKGSNIKELDFAGLSGFYILRIHLENYFISRKLFFSSIRKNQD